MDLSPVMPLPTARRGEFATLGLAVSGTLLVDVDMLKVEADDSGGGCGERIAAAM